jgi:hypothetical protein
MGTSKSPQPPQVVLRKPKTIVGILMLAKAVYQAVLANKGTFPTPNPPLAQFSSDITTLDTAQTATETHTKGTVAARNAALAVVVTDLDHMRAYVQQVVDADPSNAATIAQNAGLSLRKTTPPSKSDLAAKPNPKTSGSVDVAAKLDGLKHVAHDWQYSTDGGKTWTSAPTTLQAKTTIAGLTPGSTVTIRTRAITKTGPELWSQPVSMIVV